MKTTIFYKAKAALSIICPLSALLFFSACENGDNDFPNYDHTAVYFSNQGYIRTIELGEDPQVDLTNDNLHQISINAAIGGGYSNDKDIRATFVVDPSICVGQKFSDGTAVTVMPENYYTLDDNKLIIPAGKIQGGVTVHFTDAFFADANAVKNTYVIPLRITKVEGADSILKGQDFVLCAVKYVNPWHADYLRHGVDEITTAAEKVTVVRHNQYVENDEVIKLATKAFNQVVMTVNMKDNTGKNVPCQLLLTFDNDNKCTISALTAGFTAQGTGSFVKNGEKNSMGGKDRNALYLNYTLASESLAKSQTTTDTLVVRNRGIKQEYFTVSK